MNPVSLPTSWPKWSRRWPRTKPSPFGRVRCSAMTATLWRGMTSWRRTRVGVPWSRGSRERTRLSRKRLAACSLPPSRRMSGCSRPARREPEEGPLSDSRGNPPAWHYRWMLSPFAHRPWVVRRNPVLIFAPILVLASLLSAPSARSASTTPIELKVLEFNIEYGGVHVSFEKVVEVIRRSHADVVAIEEAQGHTLALQRALGWPYASPRLQILSKYPLIDPPGANGLYLFIQLAPGQVVAIENVHLPPNPYGPFEVKQGDA